MTQAVIYTRFSPRPGASESESIETQLDACKRFCDGRGLAIREHFADPVQSGKSTERPVLWQAIDALHRGDQLVVYRLDRLTRNAFDSYIIEKAIGARQASLTSVSGEGTWDDDPDTKFVRGILYLCAERERLIIGVRTSMAMKRHIRNGRKMSSKTPYGWTWDPDDPKRMIPLEHEQASVQRMIALREEGLSLRKIAAKMDEEGHKARVPQWSFKTIDRVLKRAAADQAG